ncbi:hypothetical protein PSENEW3n2_00000748 [Picochlorum sp. SENEW3]|nr:hypothetical protein PSENEW3n2_00000748 [Picochlorum sp. SENEW3]WPT15669.1 hypothetical protein PSENEW3_00000748 [Picochlorum sp. SENEW3]
MNRSDSRSPRGSSGSEEITSTYRAMYGGPSGSSFSSWKSSMSPQLSPKAGSGNLSKGSEALEHEVEMEQPSLAGLVEDLHISHVVGEEKVQETGESYGGFLTPIRDGARSREGEDDFDIRDSVSVAVRDISVLTTGSASSQKDALLSLVTIINQSHVEALQGIHSAGGTHILHMNISSSDKQMRRLCTEGLVEMMEVPGALEELLSSREILSRVFGAALRDLLLSGDAISQRLLTKIVSSGEGRVEACCAEHKIMNKLLKKVEKDFEAHPDAESGALELLQSMVLSGREYFLNSAVWNGALNTLIPLLCSERIRRKDHILKTIWTLCAGQRDVARMLCTPNTIKGLSSILADPSYSMNTQLEVCRVLFKICAISRKGKDVKIALQDYCLPRVSELIHQSKSEHQKQATSPQQQPCVISIEQNVWATCAAIISLLARDSTLCCHIIFQAGVLLHCVRLLTESCEYRLCKELLDATASYASCS